MSRFPLAALSVFLLAGLCTPITSTSSARAAVLDDEPAITQLDAQGRSPDAFVVAGRIDAVTVYRGQALVTRTVDLSAGKALREIVITDLPDAVIPASLYAEAAGGIEVRSVRYVARPVTQDARENVRALEQQIRAAQDTLAAAQASMKLNDQHAALLDKLENFVAPTAATEMTKGVLNAETLAKIVESQRAQRLGIVASQQKLLLESRATQEQIAQLNRELQTLTRKSSRTAREAIVFLSGATNGGSIRLSYLVDQASWSPSYNLRKNADGSNVTVEYQASVRQLSGEDWPAVQMTLSTATPALLARGPALLPIRVALTSAAQPTSRLESYKDKSFDDAKRDLWSKQRAVENDRNFAISPVAGQAALGAGGRTQGLGGSNINNFVVAGNEQDLGLNQLANDSSLLDLVIKEKVERKSAASAGQPAAPGIANEESVSVTYKLPARTSLPSRSDEQLIQIATAALPMTAAKVATPALTSYIYDQATVTNTGDTVLLTGPAASYSSGEFVGRGGVPTVTTGETFSAGFGIDSSLRTARELVERTDTTQGGNRVIELTYRLSIENFGKSAANVRLLDRIPQPKGTDIRVTLVPGPGVEQLSKDELYLKTENKNGILRWDVSVPAGATGPKTFAIEYKFRVEFDKQMNIGESELK